MRTLCLTLLCGALLASCTTRPRAVQHSDSLPEIYPDYIGVTIPAGIAPLNFDLVDACDYVEVEVSGSQGGRLRAHGKHVDFNLRRWHTLTAQNRGGVLTVSVRARRGSQWTEYQPFDIYVSSDTLAAWGVTYRRIAPGYEIYGHIGLYQRDLSTFRESTIIENTLVPGACFNCHTANQTSPTQYTFHVRGDHGATYIHYDGGDDVLKAVNDSLGGTLVYPYWHPSGAVCAYSTNTTRQGFHAVRDERVEVFDQASDVLLYFPSTRTILRDSIVATATHYETYPVFAPTGDTLYFCSSTAEPIPQRYQEIRYNLCRVAYDQDSCMFRGEVDTIFNARAIGKSAIHPRPSYDGRYLMFTLADYGCFPIWHAEADNWLLDLTTREAWPLTAANSAAADSWHNWSADSRWCVFTSRRDDGLYTRLYLCHIDADGVAAKPFLLPQRAPQAYYADMLYSYNTPDFTAAPVRLDKRKAAKAISAAQRVPTTLTNVPKE